MWTRSRALGRPSAQQLFALALVGALLLMLFPVPPGLLDLLLSAQLAGALLVLFAALASPQPLALSQLPSVLLLGTLFRLALNLSTTRQILSQGYAGEVVEAFGRAVTRDDLLIGAVLFLLITAVQYLVIARGAERIAQVSARFALDALPGRQLEIDAQVRAGSLDPHAAQAQRERLARESSQLGALDGAMRFIKGDALVGLVIVGVNALGGLAVGLGRQQLSWGEALERYTRLTVGDGLLSQLPAVLMATAAALLVTRIQPASGRSPSAQLSWEFFQPWALQSVGLALILFGLLPGLPLIPLWIVGLGGLWAARQARSAQAQSVAPIEAPLCVSVHPLAERAVASVGIERVAQRARAQLEAQWGVALPAVRIERPINLPPGGYLIQMGEQVLHRDSLAPQEVYLCPAPEGGRPAPHPHTSAPGAWFAQGHGLDPAQYLENQLWRSWQRAGAAVLGVQHVADRLAQIAAHSPALVAAVVPRRVEAAELAQLVQALSAEGVAVARLKPLLEILSGRPAQEPHAARLRAVRCALRAEITQQLAPQGYLPVIYAEGELAQAWRSGQVVGERLEAVHEQLEARLAQQPQAALVVAPDLRAKVQAQLAERWPGLAVLSTEELPPSLRPMVVGLLSDDEEPTDLGAWG